MAASTMASTFAGKSLARAAPVRAQRPAAARAAARANAYTEELKATAATVRLRVQGTRGARRGVGWGGWVCVRGGGGVPAGPLGGEVAARGGGDRRARCRQGHRCAAARRTCGP